MKKTVFILSLILSFKAIADCTQENAVDCGHDCSGNNNCGWKLVETSDSTAENPKYELTFYPVYYDYWTGEVLEEPASNRKGQITKYGSDTSWYQYRDNITSVVIEGSSDKNEDGSTKKDSQGNWVNSKGIESIGNYIFSYMPNLQSVTIPNSVTAIGEEAFRFSGLSTVVVPDTCSRIYGYAFADMNNLEAVVIEGSPTIYKGAFIYSGNPTIYCKEEALNQCQNKGSTNVKSYSVGSDGQITMDGNIYASMDAFKAAIGIIVPAYNNEEDIPVANTTSPQKITYDGQTYTKVCNEQDLCSYQDEDGHALVLASNEPNPVVDPNSALMDEQIKPARKSKLIYTVEEASKLSKPTGNTFRLRYK
ncbi:MAG: leucine-rich repeat domain-containing protein [Alphaproteobacteria bacterium]|nr:leucine-rich repeat domain-containing protein [Alphaproteobacteria bacterium]